MAPVRIRVRHPDGTLQVQAADDWTTAQLVDHLRQQTGIQHFSLKAGFPPAPLDLADRTSTLAALGLNGSAVTLTPAEAAVSQVTMDDFSGVRDADASGAGGYYPGGGGGGSGSKLDDVSISWPEMDGCMVVRVMADDNSCLFTALSAALVPGVRDPAPYLRNQIAEYILSHPETYNAVVLSKPPEQYVRNLRGKDFWGGGIEISILSNIYDIQIVAVDVQSGQAIEHGENKMERCLVLYSGIHYDRIVFACEPDYPPDADVTRFGVEDPSVLERAKELAAKFRKSGYFTDTNTMLLRCLVPGCEWLGDVKTANGHSQATGHLAFDEIPDK